MPTGVYERKLRPIEDRFWAKVDKRDPGICWLWTGGATAAGYGTIGRGSRQNGDKGYMYAHRLSFEIHNGPIPDGLLVCHRCDVPACVNPAHLFVGTVKDNVQDMLRKGRASCGLAQSLAVRERAMRGSTHLNAKLTEADVLLMRKMHARGGLTSTQLAKHFGVHRRTINGILQGVQWRHLLVLEREWP